MNTTRAVATFLITNIPENCVVQIILECFTEQRPVRAVSSRSGHVCERSAQYCPAHPAHIGRACGRAGRVRFIWSVQCITSVCCSRAVLRNPDVRGSQSPWLAFGHDFWGTPLRSAGSHGSYRPLSVLSFRANAYLAGGLRPHAFHLVSRGDELQG